MPIAAASDALVRHLRARLDEDGGGLDGWAVEATTLPEARGGSGRGIALVLWRVQPDEPAGDEPPARVASKADPPGGGGLKLRYLLVVRGDGGGQAQQDMLGRCVAALDRHPVVEGPGEEPGALAATALVAAMESPSDELYLKLVEACGDPPPLVVPYAVSNVRLLPPAAGRIPDPPEG